MKKILAALLCVILAAGCGLAAAESVAKEDYTVVPVNGMFNIRGITPEGYKMADYINDDTAIVIWFEPEDQARPSFVISLSFLEEYAGVERLNDLSDEEMRALAEDDPTVSQDIQMMETDYGTKVMILRAANPSEDFACFVTLYKGYEVGLNMFPGPQSNGQLTDEQISQAMKFLSDLDFVPIEAGT